MENETKILHEINKYENNFKILPTKNTNFLKKCFWIKCKNNFSQNILKNSLENADNKNIIEKSLIKNDKIMNLKHLNKSKYKIRNTQYYPIKLSKKLKNESRKEIEKNKKDVKNDTLISKFNKYTFMDNDSWIKFSKNTYRENDNIFSLNQFAINHINRVIKIHNIIFKKRQEKKSNQPKKREINKKLYKNSNRIFNKEQSENEKSFANFGKYKESNKINDNDNNNMNMDNIKLMKKDSIVQLDFSSYEDKDKFYSPDKIKKRNKNIKKNYISNKNKLFISRLKKYRKKNNENIGSKTNSIIYNINESADLPLFSKRKNNFFLEESNYSNSGQNSFNAKNNKSIYINKPINFKSNSIKVDNLKNNNLPKIKFIPQIEKKSNSVFY